MKFSNKIFATLPPSSPAPTKHCLLFQMHCYSNALVDSPKPSMNSFESADSDWETLVYGVVVHLHNSLVQRELHL